MLYRGRPNRVGGCYEFRRNSGFLQETSFRFGLKYRRNWPLSAGIYRNFESERNFLTFRDSNSFRRNRNKHPSPTGADKDIEVEDDMSVESAILTGSNSEEDQTQSKKKKKKKKQREAKTVTKGDLDATKTAYLQKRLKSRKMEEAKNILELINIVSRCMDTTQRPNVMPIRTLPKK